MSTDLLKRREARRRKILENSENRIRLITGNAETKSFAGDLYTTDAGPSDDIVLNGEINLEVKNISSSTSVEKTEIVQPEHNFNIKHIENLISNVVSENKKISQRPTSASHSDFMFVLAAVIFRIIIELNSQEPYLQVWFTSWCPFMLINDKYNYYRIRSS